MLNVFKNSKVYPLVQRALRVFQFLSALTSLIVFSVRVSKLSKLTNQLSNANGAVEGIVATAVAYTLGVMIVTFLVKGAHGATSNLLRWFLVLMDVLFVGAFIGVAILTNPKDGRAGPCRTQLNRGNYLGGVSGDSGCKLPLGTFVTAIISTILHTLTAIFQNIREKRREHVLVEKNNTYEHAGGRGSTTLHGGRDSSIAPAMRYNHGSNAV